MRRSSTQLLILQVVFFDTRLGEGRVAGLSGSSAVEAALKSTTFPQRVHLDSSAHSILVMFFLAV